MSICTLPGMSRSEAQVGQRIAKVSVLTMAVQCGRLPHAFVKKVQEQPQMP